MDRSLLNAVRCCRQRLLNSHVMIESLFNYPDVGARQLVICYNFLLNPLEVVAGVDFDLKYSIIKQKQRRDPRHACLIMNEYAVFLFHAYFVKQFGYI